MKPITITKENFEAEVKNSEVTVLLDFWAEWCGPCRMLAPTIDEIAEERGEDPFIVILDGVEDPYNLGAVVRCAECAGAHGVIIPKRRAAGLTPAAAKSSAGALEHMAVAKVVNISAAIEELQAAGVWVYAAEADGDELYGVDMNRPSAFVFGSEGRGVSRLVCEKSDYKVSIPMYGKVNSMNVSTAAAVVLTEAARQKHS